VWIFYEKNNHSWILLMVFEKFNPACFFPSYLPSKPYYYKQYNLNSLITCNCCSCWACIFSELASATNLPRPLPRPHPLGCLWPAFTAPLCWPLPDLPLKPLPPPLECLLNTLYA
jgi:hypothetical protein